MSEPRYTTSNQRAVKCARCNADTFEQESRGLYGSGPTWKLVSHPSPCGLPCFGGGAAGPGGLAAYRAGEMHGLGTRPCPTCTGEPAQVLPARSAR